MRAGSSARCAWRRMRHERRARPRRGGGAARRAGGRCPGRPFRPAQERCPANGCTMPRAPGAVRGAITRLPEYYPTRTETEILRNMRRRWPPPGPGWRWSVRHGDAARPNCCWRGCSARGLRADRRPRTGMLEAAAAAALRPDPGLPVAGDGRLHRALRLPKRISAAPRLGFFPAPPSAISNPPRRPPSCGGRMRRWVRGHGMLLAEPGEGPGGAAERL